jgi:prepilin peptidase CpaA
MANAVDFSYAARLLLVAVLVICATIQDLTSQRISNRLLAAFLILGAIAWSTGNGFSGLKLSLLSALLVFIFLFPFFMLRALSGGDVKLFAVIAGLTGIQLFVPIFTLSLVAGGFAGAIVWLRRRLVLRHRKKGTEEGGWVQSEGDLDQNMMRFHRFPFAYPILVGTFFGILGEGNLSALLERL